MFSDADRAISDQLLGRQRAHWSFFMDSDGSVMEGNEIEDLGGGTFRTTVATEKYSRLDLYAMGLATRGRGAALVLCRRADLQPDRDDRAARRAHLQRHAPRRADPGRDRRARPACPVRGRLATRAPAGIRVRPAANRRARTHKTSARLARIREQFGPFFSSATENRMTVRTTLIP